MEATLYDWLNAVLIDVYYDLCNGGDDCLCDAFRAWHK